MLVLPMSALVNRPASTEHIIILGYCFVASPRRLELWIFGVGAYA
jgi:hypothetical protein